MNDENQHGRGLGGGTGMVLPAGPSVTYEVEALPGGRFGVRRFKTTARGGASSDLLDGHWGSVGEAEAAARMLRAERADLELAASVGAELHRDSGGALHRIVVKPGAHVTVERHAGNSVRVVVEQDGRRWTGQVLVGASGRGRR